MPKKWQEVSCKLSSLDNLSLQSGIFDFVSKQPEVEQKPRESC